MGVRRLEDGGSSSSSSSGDVPYDTLEPGDEEEEDGAISGARKRSALSEDENKSRKRLETSAMVARISLSWIPQALAYMQAARILINGNEELRAHPSPHSCLPDLRTVRTAAMDFVHDTDDAILFAQKGCESIKKKILREQLLGLQGELARQQELLQEAMEQSAHYSKLLAHTRRKSSNLAALLQQARAESTKKTALLHSARMVASKQAALLDHACTDSEKQGNSSEKGKGSRAPSHMDHQLRALRKQSEEEREKSVCFSCHVKSCDTVIQPCLHFQYCFSCLLRHWEINNNTCPTCRGPIQGLSMSSQPASH